MWIRGWCKELRRLTRGLVFSWRRMGFNRSHELMVQHKENDCGITKYKESNYMNVHHIIKETADVCASC